MIRVKAEPMPGNPASERIGDKSGLWMVVIYDYGTGSYRDPNLRGRTHSENHTYEEAQALATRLERELNPA
jgi:hypothetical protein